MSYYQGKRVFITGGSAGIGRDLATQLARLGAHVAVSARGQDALDETVVAMRAAAPSEDQHFIGIAADVTDVAAMREAAAKAIDELGGMDMLIANAGYAQSRAVADADDAHFRALMDVNYFGHVNTVRAFIDHFSEQGSGDIILVSSMLAVLSVWGYSAYSASKFAVRGFAEALRQEMLLKGVRVKLFLPPTTDTPGLAKENADKPPLTYEMETGSSLNATHAADKVVAKMLKWIPKKGFLGYATWDSWLQYFSSRHFPNLTLWMADGEMFGALKRMKANGSSEETNP